MGEFSKRQLKDALQNIKKYKNTQALLQQIGQNPQNGLHVIVSEALIQILKCDENELISKLQVFRFLKDIILTGNMKFFTSLHPQIEEYLFKAAIYNYDFDESQKNESRGDNYFIQMGVPQSKKVRQLGNSYVLFATEIIQFCGKNYPKHIDTQEKTNYYTYYAKLKEVNLQFKSVYFKKEDEEEFKTNFTAWMKSKSEMRRKEKGKKGKDSPREEKDNRKQQKKNKKYEQNEKQTNRDQNKEKEKEKEEQKQKEKEKEEEMMGEIKNLRQIIKEQSKKLKEKEEEISLLEIKNRKQKEQLEEALKGQKEKGNDQRKEINKIKEEIEREKEIYMKELEKHEEWKLKNNKQVEISLKEKEEMICQLSREKENWVKKEEEMQRRISNLLTQNEQKNQKKKIEEFAVEEKERKINELEEKLKDNLSIYEQNMKDLQTKLKSNNNKIKRQNKWSQTEGSQSGVQKRKQIKQQVSGQKEDYKKLMQRIRQVKTDEKKEKKESMSWKKQNPSTIDLNKDHVERKISQICIEGKENGVYRKSSSSHSLMKTQNKRRVEREEEKKEKKDDRNQLFSKTTSSSFYRRYSKQKKNAMIITFPFIKEYFSPLQVQNSQNFRASSFIDKRKTIPFFVDGELSLSLTQEHHFEHYISITNKQSRDIIVNVQLEKCELKIQGKKYDCIGKGLTSIFPIVGQVTNLNFRFPILKLKLEKGDKKVNYRLPLPITLVSFCLFKQSGISRWEENCGELAIYKSEKFRLNEKRRSLAANFPFLHYEKEMDGTKYEALVTYKYIPEIRVKLVMREESAICEIEIYFNKSSKIGEAFAKVLVQILNFLLL